VKKIEPEGTLLNGIPEFIAVDIQNRYLKELEPFYSNIFNILDLSITEKIFLIQSIENSSASDSVKLELDEDETKQFNKMVEEMREEIMIKTPDIFENKVIFTKYTVPVGNIFKLNIDHLSFQNLLSLKVTSPKSPQYHNLKPETIKALTALHKVMNPLPRNDIRQEKMENDKNVEKRINATLLGTLLEQLS